MDSQREWRCAGCGKLLGRRKGRRFHINSSSSHEYLTPFPVTGICKWCRTRNAIEGAGRPAASSAPSGKETSG
jgi:hypothetical protein